MTLIFISPYSQSLGPLLPLYTIVLLYIYIWPKKIQFIQIINFSFFILWPNLFIYFFLFFPIVNKYFLFTFDIFCRCFFLLLGKKQKFFSFFIEIIYNYHNFFRSETRSISQKKNFNSSFLKITCLYRFQKLESSQLKRRRNRAISIKNLQNIAYLLDSFANLEFLQSFNFSKC